MVKKRRLNSVPKSRVIEKSPSRGDELVSARDRFKGALQDLLPHSEDDSDSSEDDGWTNKSKRQQKKKPQVEAPAEDKQHQQPFVMKLFDRSVDLAQFTENTGLYVICRAWMANQPHQTYNIAVPPPKRSQTPEIKEEPMSPGREEEFVKDTYWLPPPSDRYDKVEGNIRIPAPIKRTTEYEKMFEEEVEPPSKEDLLKDNLNHWQRVRKSWHDASKNNEDRYSRSLKTLVAIFNKAQRQSP
ncbi:hypothetical protein GE061_002385 [Apolygus lucorum]|uniref:Uncharacterized protein n=1 Tax=Apolygus lucorum TaxID=248454 RepID=A0A6A4JMM3_APOLU|nr:hypothetical protein GE061_002385 [Apolygus lucorum]